MHAATEYRREAHALHGQLFCRAIGWCSPDVEAANGKSQTGRVSMRLVSCSRPCRDAPEITSSRSVPGALRLARPEPKSQSPSTAPGDLLRFLPEARGERRSPSSELAPRSRVADRAPRTGGAVSVSARGSARRCDRGRSPCRRSRARRARPGTLPRAGGHRSRRGRPARSPSCRRWRPDRRA